MQGVLKASPSFISPRIRKSCFSEKLLRFDIDFEAKPVHTHIEI